MAPQKRQRSHEKEVIEISSDSSGSQPAKRAKKAHPHDTTVISISSGPSGSGSRFGLVKKEARDPTPAFVLPPGFLDPIPPESRFGEAAEGSAAPPFIVRARRKAEDEDEDDELRSTARFLGPSRDLKDTASSPPPALPPVLPAAVAGPSSSKKKRRNKRAYNPVSFFGDNFKYLV